MAKTIQFITFSQANLIDFAGPLEVFLTANFYSDPKAQPYKLSITSLDDTATLADNADLHTIPLERSSPAPHTLIVPGGPGIHSFCRNPRFNTIFKAHAEKAIRLVSVCTGVFALAATGQLKGREATTHWSAYAEFEQSFPDVLLKRGPIFVNDGHIWTSAGVTSGIDLALALVEIDLGHAIALKVAKHLVVFLKRPGDQNQFSTSLDMQTKSGNFSDLHAWVQANLVSDLSIKALATRMHMTERTFIRRYRESTGITPRKMVEQFRIDAARSFLINTSRPLKEIAYITGLGHEATLIRKFSSFFGVTPNEYRGRFKSSF
ncbi:helix-turn-helix domain-containing protein [Pseudomonas sp. C98]|uniref:Helix-turn-helix domain-containing protein n=2 Tax=Pseudomonas mercuritolerans TaxID=2951809 RepID=A0ABT2XZ02_9PSED|nr:helix-turn-helix domain-containing protein [Pseudomonas mercuritolerans]